MSFNDPIAELLTKIRNAKDAQHRFVDLSYSKMKVKILELLKHHGFIENFLVNEQQFKMRVFLRYTKERGSVIRGLKPSLFRIQPSSSCFEWYWNCDFINSTRYCGWRNS